MKRNCSEIQFLKTERRIKNEKKKKKRMNINNFENSH